MLMAAVVPRDTVVTYKAPRGTKVNLSTAHHVALADTGHVCPFKGDLVSEDDQSPSHTSLARVKSSQVQGIKLSSTGVTNHLITAELNYSTGSLSNLCHATSNTSVAQLARAAITRANTCRKTTSPPKSSTSTSVSLGKDKNQPRSCHSFRRASSLCSDSNDSRCSLYSRTTEASVAIPLDKEEREEVESKTQDPRAAMLKSSSLTFTPVLLSQQPPLWDQHGFPQCLDRTPSNLQQRRSGLLTDHAHCAKYRTSKNVSFDCDTRTETFETEVTESETDERDFVRLTGNWERRPHLRLPVTTDNSYCPPGKEEQDLLPKVLCFALALVITGGILYGFNLLISRMNMNLFSG
ncbi:uncharacterized protein [Cherax quadricarinatus]|uniref:uncharacterized protein n=1 Tax=Cherax quadricarinatus TaxID=27406 RepID=UPI00387EE116